jgi:hypothetical protein
MKFVAIFVWIAVGIVACTVLFAAATKPHISAEPPGAVPTGLPRVSAPLASAAATSLTVSADAGARGN